MMRSVLAQRIASIGLLAALFVLPLYPKIGLVSVSGTYIPVRFDDLIIAFAAAVWLAALLPPEVAAGPSAADYRGDAVAGRDPVRHSSSAPSSFSRSAFSPVSPIGPSPSNTCSLG